MKVEQAKQIASKAIEQLSEALERGHSETLRNYLAAMARFHRYSLHNLILIVSQRPDATRVAGFHTWKQLGRSVKKGTKGIMILAPVVLTQMIPRPISTERLPRKRHSSAKYFGVPEPYPQSKKQPSEIPRLFRRTSVCGIRAKNTLLPVLFFNWKAQKKSEKTTFESH
jgi:N-terminal domain of anti-restriction factor ArdC